MSAATYKPPTVLSSGATLSPDGLYRFDLWRIWDHAKPLALFVMLNPSKANGSEDDPTIRRCIRFADTWGYGGFTVGNLFAFRATDPSDLAGLPPTAAIGGSVNDVTIYDRAAKAGAVILAWGIGGSLHGRGKQVAGLLRRFDPYSLGRTDGGQPRHPLYVRADKSLEPWGGP